MKKQIKGEIEKEEPYRKNMSYKDKKRKSVYKLLAWLLTGALTITMPATQTYAATVEPDFYRTAYSDVAAAFLDAVEELQFHYDNFGKAEGRSANLEDAVKKHDIRSILLYFLAHNADIYRANGLTSGFPFFDADKYLAENPDVADVVGNNRTAALEHYLTYGAIEGRSSGTVFDPIIAITARPELGQLPAEELVSAWIQAEGKVSTEDYTLKLDFNGAIPEKYEAKKIVPLVAVSSDEHQSSSSVSYDNSEYGSEIIKAVSDNKKEQSKSTTLMLYLCGTDLERKNSSATSTLLTTLVGLYDNDNANAIILAGGTDIWENTYMNDLLGGRDEGQVNKSAILVANRENIKARIDEIIRDYPDINSIDDLYNNIKNYNDYTIFNKLINEYTLPMLGSVGQNKMGDTETLSLLLEAAKTEAMADNYILSIWNHGGGSMEGVCTPDDKTSLLTIPEIGEALAAAGFGSTATDSQYKLGILAFDACLMGGAETAAYLSQYYDLMYASEETTAGDLNYYTMLSLAGSKANENNLNYILAQAIFKDRTENYKGNERLTSTAAIYENDKSQEALSKLNDVAQRLNQLVNNAGDDTANKVYVAFKRARLMCEFLGAETAANDSRDYVDMKDFLQRLRDELDAAEIFEMDDGLSAAITAAIQAADEASYANSFNYNGQRVYSDILGAENVWLNADFWKQLKGNMELSGANIYVPYFDAKDNSVEGRLNFYNENYKNLSLGEYHSFISKFSDYLNSDAEKERIEKLKTALISGSESDSGSSSTEGSGSSSGGASRNVTGYADMFDMSLVDSAAGQVLSVKVKDYEEGSASQYSSGDAFIDMIETMDTMLVYITRKARANYAVNNMVVEGRIIDIDIVVGNKTIPYENLNGNQSAVNIFTSEFDDTNMSVVKNIEYSLTDEDYTISNYDFVVSSDLEGHDDVKSAVATCLSEYLNEQLPSDGGITPKPYNLTKDNCITLKGTAIKKVDAGGGSAPEEPENTIISDNVYHIFELNAGQYIYRGSVQITDKDEDEGSDSWSYAVINGVGEITFYHQTIDSKNNKLVYAEEYSFDVDSDEIEGESDTYSITSLFGAKTYTVSKDNEIVIEDKAIGSIGNKTDNGYYFAVSQVRATTDDDIISSDSVKDETYSDSDGRDIYDALEEAMNAGSGNSAGDGKAAAGDKNAAKVSEANASNVTMESISKDSEEIINHEETGKSANSETNHGSDTDVESGETTESGSSNNTDGSIESGSSNNADGSIESGSSENSDRSIESTSRENSDRSAESGSNENTDGSTESDSSSDSESSSSESGNLGSDSNESSGSDSGETTSGSSDSSSSSGGSSSESSSSSSSSGESSGSGSSSSESSGSGSDGDGDSEDNSDED